MDSETGWRSSPIERRVTRKAVGSGLAFGLSDARSKEFYVFGGLFSFFCIHSYVNPPVLRSHNHHTLTLQTPQSMYSLVLTPRPHAKSQRRHTRMFSLSRSGIEAAHHVGRSCACASSAWGGRRLASFGLSGANERRIMTERCHPRDA